MNNNIKTLRLQLNIGQKECSKGMGIGQSMLSEIERGERNPSYITKDKILTFFSRQFKRTFKVTDVFLLNEKQ